MGRIVMGYWDCKFCDSKTILGSMRDCPNCGKPRDNETQFYTDPVGHAKAVDEKTAEEVRRRGKDWICEYCNSLNSGLADFCSSCGAEKSELRYRVPDPEPEHTAQPQRLLQPTVARESPPVKKRINWKRFAQIAAAVLVVVAIGFLVVGLLTPKDIDLRVSDMEWVYSIDIEEYRTVQESGWSLPPGGRLLYTQSEIHHYEQVLDYYEQRGYQEIDYYEEVVVGYRDLGNGYMEEVISQKPHYKTVYRDEPVYRSDPVYQSKYYYEIEKWIFSRSVTTSGHDKEPFWGDTGLSNLERESTRHETYKVYGYDSDNKSRECKVSHSFWLSCEIGDQISGKVDVFGNFTPNTSRE